MRAKVALVALLSLVGALIVVAPAVQAAIMPDTWYTVTATGSGKCVDARGAGTANGTVVQQYACNQTASQHWQPVEEAGGAYHFVSRNSGRCLDVPGASTADSTQLQQYACNGSGAQSFRLSPVTGTANPDLGPNVLIFDPSMSQSAIQSQLNSVFSRQETAQFDAGRYALMFKPGVYNVDVNAGFCTQVFAAAVDFPQLAVRRLDRFQLEHGVRRRQRRTRREFPEPAAHHGEPDAGRAREAVPVHRQRRGVPGFRALTQNQLAGYRLECQYRRYRFVVNGDDVTMYGLFVEHYQKYQTIWNGNGGRTYFYQNEMPYDPPNQAAWMNGSTPGYAAYKVANSVTSHEVWGLGSYCYFNVDPSVVAARAIEVPDNPAVRFHSMVTVSLGGTGAISRVINNRGGPSDSGTNVANLVSYP